ncbi:MAG: hypothetical protein A2504_10805 [Bdellovibrionales bacterium RIFOXYD12_FULL_39_22]|nr:MAG: hypothetical protein A2385_09370 [Bdellovibrionales bacterium RIFOXYB1_FULL_39_21]OFZ44169.1 MAG: hypothetical protein A2485_06990 [Bdellovibrionales bacterium RIFOXYC12_FULL_39_17]OFZ46711.1 MAG: hypothetical protein A2404_04225 [Bdellovibrionales bacterium RIFOXYC1_FULL_39_130]OFZ72312.1 MAG: hypothetical protein A2451_08755 [Bdellovibrionales bacterium RIFOXYC2_FULL_39_8]OFZ76012.1 MAG: hypothetical protein A2560_02925 [Bdellovibrionales bacterium RIFOXYD1_FULL_39_84]OFZ95391.1 MAG:
MGAFQCSTKQELETLQITIGGAVDEDVRFPQLTLSAVKKIVFDFKELNLINSCGIREWVVWLRNIPASIEVLYRNCPRILIEQINMIEGLMPANGYIESFYLPYYCEECDKQTMLLCERGKDYTRSGMETKEFVPCSKCQGNSEIDVIESKYLKFIKQYG